LGQFNLPVTITPASNKIFFIDPVNGDDTSEGTAAEPWKSLKNVLDRAQATGARVFRAASAGNDVVVTILAGGTETGITGNISTPNLPAGSVTVLKAPSAETFTLNMGSNQLTLNKGYKLQDIRIDFNFGSSGGTTAVTIAHPTAGLASVEVTCDNGSNVKCVEVQGAGSHTLRDVTVKVEAKSGNVGIKNNTGANLSIVGGEVQLIEPTSSPGAITLINAQEVLTATGLTVDMTGGGHSQNSIGIALNKAGSSVTGSTIKVNNCTITSCTSAGERAVGIDIQHTAGKSTVARNNFIGPGTGTKTVGIRGGSKLSPDSSGNNFSGFGTLVQP
jgi:hypothetical protein